MSDDETLTQLRICGAKPGARVCALFLGNGKRTFVMHLDRAAFAGICAALQGTPAPRPSTQQLLRNVLLGLEASLERVVIHSVKNGVFYARMFLQMRNEVARKILEIDARPSDAIALALLTRSPIFCTQRVLRHTRDVTDVLKKIQENNP